MKNHPHKKETHWESSSQWYEKLVGEKGHYYHEHVILPAIESHLKETKAVSLLDLACGEGVLSRSLSKEMPYLGLDASPSLIKYAKTKRLGPAHEFLVHDLTKPFQAKNLFSHAACLLAVQNIQDPFPLFQTAERCLQSCGLFIIVLNHPCFRIPRQSSWGVDTDKQWQYRRIDRYMSPLEIPIHMHPGNQQATQTLSFHHPLSYFTALLQKANFYILNLEEWCSDKKSVGKQAVMENRSRKEFPLFLTIVAKKAC